MPQAPFPRALPAPAGELVIVSRELIERAIEASRASPRRRVILPFHKHEGEALHRMLNAVQPDSYVRPHRHLDPPKPEVFLLLRGAIAFFVFEDDGAIRACHELRAGDDTFGVDLAPGVYHGFVALEPDTVIYEVKTGPYQAASDKSFAPWAPAEDAPEAPAFLRDLVTAFERRQRER